MIEVERKLTKNIYYEATTLRTDRYFIGTAVNWNSINVYSDEKGNSGTCSKLTLRTS